MKRRITEDVCAATRENSECNQLPLDEHPQMPTLHQDSVPETEFAMTFEKSS